MRSFCRRLLSGTFRVFYKMLRSLKSCSNGSPLYWKLGQIVHIHSKMETRTLAFLVLDFISCLVSWLCIGTLFAWGAALHTIGSFNSLVQSKDLYIRLVPTTHRIIARESMRKPNVQPLEQHSNRRPEEETHQHFCSKQTHGRQARCLPTASAADAMPTLENAAVTCNSTRSGSCFQAIGESVLECSIPTCQM